MTNKPVPGELKPSEQDEARGWLVQLASGKMTREDGASFRHWLAADPAHARAFAEAKQQWHVVGAAARELVREGRWLADGHVEFGGMINRRWLLAAGVGAAAAGVALAIRPPLDLWSPLVDLSGDYRTGIGQTRTVAIDENVTVELSTRSRLSLQADRPDGLRMILLAGEVAVQTGTRAITVASGNGKTHTVSGRFNLRNDRDRVRVTCVGGTIEVSCNDRQIALRADQQVAYDDQGLSSIAAADVEEVTGWQRGVLLFRSKSLGYVVDEINRYRPGRIILIGQALKNRPVAFASFHLDHLDEVVPQMEALYGATAHYLPAGIVLLS